MDDGRRLLVPSRARALASVVASVLASVLATAGCGAPGPGDGVAAPTPSDAVATVARDGHVCLNRSGPAFVGADSPAALARLRLAPGRPARFVLCADRTQRIEAQGEWAVRVEQEATSGVEALVAALRLPDEDAGTGPCKTYADVVPELWAVSGRQAVLVRWPVDACRHLRAQAKQALGSVRWRETGRRRVEQVTPQKVIDTGCATAWKDMTAIEAADQRGPRGAGSLDRLAASAGASVCVFRVTDRSQTPTGTFERGARLRGGRWAALVSELRRTPPAVRACSGLGNRFAVLLTATADATYVELDGCRRILTPDGGFRQATTAVLAALRAV